LVEIAEKYLAVEKEVDTIPVMSNIGALCLNTSNLKMQLKSEARAWQFTFASKLHAQVRLSPPRTRMCMCVCKAVSECYSEW
jgi:hypothetical protein